MPSCAGRPFGSCPNNRNDDSVKWSVCDLWLCEDCLNFRIPNMTVSDNNSESSAMQAVTQSVHNEQADTQPVRSELLCFIQQKMNVMTADHIIKLCCDFYSKEESLAARSMLDKFVTQRLPRRQGANAVRATVEDMLRVLLDPNLRLPTFFTVDLARLPPVDVNHCDMSAVLRELQSLRAEVRQIASLRDEIDSLRQELEQLKRNSTSQVIVKESESESATNITTLAFSTNTSNETTVKLYADLAADLNNQPIIENKTRDTRLRRKSPIQGKATGSSRMVVDGVRRANLFVSRFLPDTRADDVKTMVTELFPKCQSVSVEQLKTKYDTYASFCITVYASRSSFDDLLTDIYNADIWPDGLLIRRYFSNNSKNGAKG